METRTCWPWLESQVLLIVRGGSQGFKKKYQWMSELSWNYVLNIFSPCPFWHLLDCVPHPPSWWHHVSGMWERSFIYHMLTFKPQVHPVGSLWCSTLEPSRPCSSLQTPGTGFDQISIAFRGQNLPELCLCSSQIPPALSLFCKTAGHSLVHS